jgi:cytochrome P450
MDDKTGLGQQSQVIVVRSIILLLITATGYYFVKGFTIRRRIQRMQREGVPMMPHSAVWGHLPVIGKLMATLPSDAHGDYMQVLIQQNWKELFPKCKSCPPVFIVDTWPFTTPIMITVHPDVTSQYTQEVSRVKPKEQKRFWHPLTQNLDLASMEGDTWKIWRKKLSPGFSTNSITSHITALVEEIEVFADTLRAKAGRDGAWGEMMPLEPIAKDVTFDVIGRFILGTRLHAQTNPRLLLKTALVDIIPRMVFYINPVNFFSYFNPYNQFRLWLDNRTMNKFLLPHVQTYIASVPCPTPADKHRIIPLALGNHHETPDQKLVTTVLGQLKIFLFAGHDTTASTICWIFHALSRNPKALSRLRSELDEILGPNPSARATAATLKAQPHLVNQLTYTAAVIKETLRIHTNVGTMRSGGPGFTIYGPASTPEYAGMAFPTEGCVLWDGSWAQHMDPELWHRVDEFLPERWLVTDPQDPLHPPKNGFRAFELGPRDCIGQGLGVVEMKLVLAVVAREFEIREDYGEVKEKDERVFGERAYQVGADGTPGVKGGMPVRVRVRKEAI